MAAIFFASSIPNLQTLPGHVPDKVGHFIGYAILGAALLRALADGTWRGVTWRLAIVALVLSVAYGVSDEFHQSFVPGRTADVMDVVADLWGAAAAVGLGWVAAWGILHNGRPRPSSRSTHDL